MQSLKVIRVASLVMLSLMLLVLLGMYFFQNYSSLTGFSIVSSSSTSIELRENFSVGSTYYSDRTFTISSLPVELSSGTLVMTSNSAPQEVSFITTVPATIYLLWDLRNSTPPSEFYRTDLKVLVTDQAASNEGFLQVFKKNVLNGEQITLPRKSDKSNYVLVIVPIQTGQGSCPWPPDSSSPHTFLTSNNSLLYFTPTTGNPYIERRLLCFNGRWYSTIPEWPYFSFDANTRSWGIITVLENTSIGNFKSQPDTTRDGVQWIREWVYVERPSKPQEKEVNLTIIVPITSNVSVRTCSYRTVSSETSWKPVYCNFKEISREGSDQCEGKSYSRDVKPNFYNTQKKEIYLDNIRKQIAFCANGKPFQCITYVPEIIQGTWLRGDLKELIDNPACLSVRDELRRSVTDAYRTTAFSQGFAVDGFSGISAVFHIISSLTKPEFGLVLGPAPTSAQFRGNVSLSRNPQSFGGAQFSESIVRAHVKKIMTMYWGSGLWKSEGLTPKVAESYHASWDAIVILNRFHEGFGDQFFAQMATDKDVQLCAKLSQFKRELDSDYEYAKKTYGYEFNRFAQSSSESNTAAFCSKGCSGKTDSRIDASGENLDEQIIYLSRSYRDFYYGNVLGDIVNGKSFNFRGFACQINRVCSGLCTGECAVRCAQG